MEKKIPESNNFSTFQKVLCGIAIAFYTIYKFWLKDPDIKKDLGVAYPWIVMIWVIVMLFTAGLSGWQVIAYFPNPRNLIKKNKDKDNEEV